MFVNKKGVYQPAHPHSLISFFVIHLLEIIISKLATSKISVFLPICVAEQAGLGKTRPETTEDRFSHDKAQMTLNHLNKCL